MFILIGLALTLFIPFLIVGLWRSRPFAALTAAALFLFVVPSATGIIKTYQAKMIYGAADSALVSSGINEALLTGFGVLIFCLPIVAVFQWVLRWNHRRKNPLADIDETFS